MTRKEREKLMWIIRALEIPLKNPDVDIFAVVDRACCDLHELSSQAGREALRKR